MKKGTTKNMLLMVEAIANNKTREKMVFVRNKQLETIVCLINS